MKKDVVVLSEADAMGIVSALDGADFSVRSVEEKPYTRRPQAPFMTATFQQDAGRKLGMSSAMAMRSAQSLYEKGLITYMRTDSTTLSSTAVRAARSAITTEYGEKYLPAEPRVYAIEAEERPRGARGDSTRRRIVPLPGRVSQARSRSPKPASTR